MREVPGSNPGRALILSLFSFVDGPLKFSQEHNEPRSYGVMVSTLDSESSDPSSNLGRTYRIFSQSYWELAVWLLC